MPRRCRAAARPPRSPSVPPPITTKGSERSKLISLNHVSSRSNTDIVLTCSPPSISNTRCSCSPPMACAALRSTTKAGFPRSSPHRTAWLRPRPINNRPSAGPIGWFRAYRVSSSGRQRFVSVAPMHGSNHGINVAAGVYRNVGRRIHVGACLARCVGALPRGHRRAEVGESKGQRAAGRPAGQSGPPAALDVHAPRAASGSMDPGQCRRRWRLPRRAS